MAKAGHTSLQAWQSPQEKYDISSLPKSKAINGISVRIVLYLTWAP